MEEVQRFVVFMKAFKLKTFIYDNYEISVVANEYKRGITVILFHCITNFSDNIYVVDYNESCATRQKSTNVLEEENDESISKEDESDQEENKENDKDNMIRI
jgi:hypothetical protein